MSAAPGLEGRFAIGARRLVTCDAQLATQENPLGAIDDGVLVLEQGLIVDLGPRAAVMARHPGLRLAVEAEGVVTPGLVDAHTHAPWAGSRDGEYALRMAGAGYEAIAAAGGGIASADVTWLRRVYEKLRVRLERDDAGDLSRRTERPKRSLHPNEQHLLGDRRAGPLDIIEDRVPGILWQWQAVGLSALAAHPKISVVPIDIGQAQLADIASPQSESGE